MHNIMYDKGRKAVVASLAGNIGVEQANAMMSDFKKSTNGINTGEHILIISPENVSASLFVLPILQSFIQMIAHMNFKTIYLIDSDKYAGMIKQSLGSYGIADKVRYAANIKDALSKK